MEKKYFDLSEIKLSDDGRVEMGAALSEMVEITGISAGAGLTDGENGVSCSNLFLCNSESNDFCSNMFLCNGSTNSECYNDDWCLNQSNSGACMNENRCSQG